MHSHIFHQISAKAGKDGNGHKVGFLTSLITSLYLDEVLENKGFPTAIPSLMAIQR